MADVRTLKETQTNLRKELGWFKKELEDVVKENTGFKENYNRICNWIGAVEDAMAAKVPDEQERDMEIASLKKKIEYMEDLLITVRVHSIVDYHC